MYPQVPVVAIVGAPWSSNRMTHRHELIKSVEDLFKVEQFLGNPILHLLTVNENSTRGPSIAVVRNVVERRNFTCIFLHQHPNEALSRTVPYQDCAIPRLLVS
jgi:hypothetical protein